MNSSNEPKLIALDFDQTITQNLGRGSSFICYNLANKYKKGIISKHKLVHNVFGSQNRINQLRNVLNIQKAKGNEIIILTFNTEETVKICLQATNLIDLIPNANVYGIEYIKTGTKALSLLRINIEFYNKHFSLKNIILFDDNITNCIYVKEYGMSSEYIYGNNGMQDKDFYKLKNL